MFSAALLITFAVITYMRGINWGIDFVGGVKITAQFPGKPDINTIKTKLAARGIEASVQQIGDDDAGEFIFYSKLLSAPVYEFFASEFSGGLTVADLCAAIEADNYGLEIKAEKGTIAWLNELLANPGFHAQWVALKKPAADPAVDALVKDAAAKPDLLTKLNRILIEKTYTKLTPENNTVDGASDRSYALLWGAITKEFPDAKELAVETVGPAIGKYLRKSAIKLGIAAVIMMMLYLAFRFEFRYSVGAMVALVHDVAAAFLLCGVLQIEIDIPVIAALLTIFGYSVNDTIVVFDRIRETVNAKAAPKLSQIINISITQTMSRTILTSLTTLFSVVCILMFGGDTIRNFAIILLFGITLGTFSSIFVASPILLIWERYVKKNREV